MDADSAMSHSTRTFAFVVLGLAVLMVGGTSALAASKKTPSTKIAYGPFQKCPVTEQQPVPGCVAFPGALIKPAELAKWLATKKIPLPAASVNPGDRVSCNTFKDNDPKTVDWFRANTYFARFIAFGDPASLDRGNKVAGPVDTIDRNSIDEDPIVTGVAGVPCESLAGAPQTRWSQVQ